MTLDTVLLFNAIAISFMLLAIATVRGQASFGWSLAVHAAIIGTGLAAHAYRWHGAGYCLFIASLILVVLPNMLLNWAGRAEARGNQLLAARLSWLAALLHPEKAWRFSARRAAALARSTIAERCAALEELARIAEPEHAAALRLLVMRLRSDWESILAFPAVGATGSMIAPLFLTLRIMALGHTGRLDEMVGLFQANRPMIENYPGRDQVLLTILIFCGRFDAVDRLMSSGTFASIPEAERLWTSNIARLAMGQTQARVIHACIAADTPEADKRALREKRLATPLADPTGLRPEHTAVVAGLVAQVMQNTVPEAFKLRHFPATLALIALNLAAYGMQLSQGSPESLRLLVELGGMWPPLVADGEWWRIGSALFLHAGPLHLTLNMLILGSFGYAIEWRYGSWRLLALYISGGLLSSLFVFTLMWNDIVGMAVLVGASGAIFALFGGLVVDATIRWRQDRRIEDRQRITVLAILLLLQTVFDFLTPTVSFAAHLGGFVAGLTVGAILNAFKR